jgi:hypothetical protein
MVIADYDVLVVRSFIDVLDVLQGHQELGAEVLLDRNLRRTA